MFTVGLWPMVAGLGCPWQGEGPRVRKEWEAPHPTPNHPTLTPPSAHPAISHLLLDLGTVGQGVFTAVVDSHIAGWEGGVERVKGGLDGTGGDTPTCKHPASQVIVLQTLSQLPELLAVITCQFLPCLPPPSFTQELQ